jgi:hypothetical protein
MVIVIVFAVLVVGAICVVAGAMNSRQQRIEAIQWRTEVARRERQEAQRAAQAINNMYRWAEDEVRRRSR